MMNLGGARRRNFLDAHQLDREIVFTALLVCLVYERLGDRREVRIPIRQSAQDGPSIYVLMHSIRREHKNIAGLDTDRAIVDFELRVHTQRATEVTLVL